ncbi:GlxA family transcriptional regulator [Acetobacter lovaniensis]|jgi:transcriptional regulator GlxA family with amidase domain|uniref:GlxA family transcriptional regulator n=1 Tax=Acetobacter lovaniensis TaxID=104100 RepID=UPI00209D3AF5|nr:GlxA family transcriptional regulator [Acetobacter lovaniensis]MCP1240253.1 GlxA family transcriptional regulator [Acetobacter lovaniensis]
MSVAIGILIYPGAQMSAVLGLTDLFRLAERFVSEKISDGPSLRVCHLRAEGISWPKVVFDSYSQAFEKVDMRCDVLILPPSLEPPIVTEAAKPLAAWLRECHGEGTILASVCGGAFLLGETGLLDGRVVTTHWTYAQQLRERFPKSKIDIDRLMIDGGDIISAGGLMSWIDLGLKLVGRFLGPVAMADTAHMMLVDPPGREQRYYSGFLPCLTHGDAPILRAQHFLQAKEGKEVRLSVLADQAGLEERTFLRRFQKATGLTATDYAQRLRVAKAQELLQFGQLAIERVGWEVGYSDTGAFRKVFQRVVGLSPGEYRRRFHV